MTRGHLIRSIASWLALGLACAATIATSAPEPPSVFDRTELRVRIDPTDDSARTAARALRIAVNDAVVEEPGGFAATAHIEACVASSFDSDAACSPKYAAGGEAIAPSGPRVTLTVASVEAVSLRRAEPAFLTFDVLDEETKETLDLSFSVPEETGGAPVQLLVSIIARAAFPALDEFDPPPEGAEVTIEEVEPVGETGEGESEDVAP
jgi:hypothetical protein